MVKPLTKLAAILASILFIASQAFTAPLYKWQDKDGSWHFSDQAPEDIASEDIADQLKPLNRDESGHSRKQLKKIFTPETPQEQKMEQERKTAQAQQQKQREVACAKARKRLKTMQGPVSFIDEKGNVVPVTERERQQRADAFAREVARYCD